VPLLLLAVAATVLYAAFVYQPPWRTWRPAPVVLPSPNGFDLFLQAAAVVDEPFYEHETAAERDETVSRNAAALDTLRAGLKPACYTPPPEDPSHWPPYDAHFRSLARVLARESARAADQGRWAQAVGSRLDAIEFGIDQQAGADTIGVLVGEAVEGIGQRGMAGLVGQLSAAEARAALQRANAAAPRRPSLAEQMACEKEHGQRWMVWALDTHQWPRFVREELFGYTAPEFQWRHAVPLAVSAWPVRAWRDSERSMDSVIAWARQPYGTAEPPAAPPDQPFADIFDPNSCRSAATKWAAADANLALLRAALALQAHRAERGAYPDELAALVPAYLEAVPTDPFDGKPLRYRRDGGSYVLYSVGPDRRDDGGRAIRDQQGEVSHVVFAESTGDIVWGVNDG
jgi:hypothetical protein